MHRPGGQPAGDRVTDGLRRRCLRGLEDRAPVGLVRRLQRDVAAVAPAAADVPAGRVDVGPARGGELGGLRGDPRLLAHRVPARPRLVGQDQPVGRVGEARVERGDDGPVDGGGHLPVQVVPVVGPGHRGRAAVVVLRPVLAGPQLLAGGYRVRAARAGGLGGHPPAGVVRADDLHRLRERAVGHQVVGDGPVGVGADDLHAGVAVGVQRGAQLLIPADVVAALVPAAQVVDRQAVGLGAVQPAHQVADHVGGPEVPAADPPRRPPGQPVQLDVGVAGLGRLHQRPLIPDVAGDRAAGMLDAGLRTVGGVGVAADLHLQDLQVRRRSRA